MALTLQQARQVVEACLARAAELGVQQAVAVVDPAGNLVTLDRMDGTRLGRERFAEGKAFAAVFFRRSTRESARKMEETPELFAGAASLFPGRLFVVAGGFPILAGGELLGGLGVSGGSGEQDEDVAEAGLRVLRG